MTAKRSDIQASYAVRSLHKLNHYTYRFSSSWISLLFIQLAKIIEPSEKVKWKDRGKEKAMTIHDLCPQEMQIQVSSDLILWSIA